MVISYSCTMGSFCSFWEIFICLFLALGWFSQCHWRRGWSSPEFWSCGASWSQAGGWPGLHWGWRSHSPRPTCSVHCSTQRRHRRLPWQMGRPGWWGKPAGPKWWWWLEKAGKKTSVLVRGCGLIFHPGAHLSTLLFTYASIHPPLHLAIYLSIHLLIYQLIYPFKIFLLKYSW